MSSISIETSPRTNDLEQLLVLGESSDACFYMYWRGNSSQLVPSQLHQRHCVSHPQMGMFGRQRVDYCGHLRFLFNILRNSRSIGISVQKTFEPLRWASWRMTFGAIPVKSCMVVTQRGTALLETSELG